MPELPCSASRCGAPRFGLLLETVHISPNIICTLINRAVRRIARATQTVSVIKPRCCFDCAFSASGSAAQWIHTHSPTMSDSPYSQAADHSSLHDEAVQAYQAGRHRRGADTRRSNPRARTSEHVGAIHLRGLLALASGHAQERAALGRTRDGDSAGADSVQHALRDSTEARATSRTRCRVCGRDSRCSRTSWRSTTTSR